MFVLYNGATIRNSENIVCVPKLDKIKRFVESM